MEAKKYSKYDLESKHGLFFNIGLVVSLAAVIGVMEWKSFDRDGAIALKGQASDFEEIMDIPVTEQPPPPPPKTAKSINIIEVPDVEEIEDEIDVELDIDITESTAVEEFEISEEPVEEEEIEEIFTIVEEQPTPAGGYEAFYTYVGNNLRYPPSAIRLGIEGKVFVEFVVGHKGEISQVRVVKGISAECDKEAIRVIQNAPNWNPGKQRGRPVKVRMIIPITFVLDKTGV